MPQLWTQARTAPHVQALDYRVQKAGVTMERQAIPWNADAVVVEATLRRQRNLEALRQELSLRLDDSLQTYSPVELASAPADDNLRLRFRLPPPAQRSTVDLLWRGRSLAQMTLPVLSRAAFCRGLALQMPTPAVRLGTHIVPCQTYVSTQGQELLATALLCSETGLAPIVDLDLRAEFRAERGGTLHEIPVRLTGAQLAGQRALVIVGLPKPRRVGPWHLSWKLGDTLLVSQRLRAITKTQFLRSLRLTDSQLIVQTSDGRIYPVRKRPPLDGIARLGPCFLLQSTEPGMAATCTVQIRIQASDGTPVPAPWQQDLLITEGPTPMAPGTIAARDVEEVRGFEVRVGSRLLGVLPLTASPTASFNSEGGFRAPEQFLWNEFADQEFHERLNRLLNDA